MGRIFTLGMTCSLVTLMGGCGNQEGDTIPSQAIYQNIYLQVSPNVESELDYEGMFVVGYNNRTTLDFKNIELTVSDGVNSIAEQYTDVNLYSDSAVVNNRDVPFNGIQLALNSQDFTNSQPVTFPIQFSVETNTDLITALKSSISFNGFPEFTQDYSISEFYSEESVHLAWQQNASTPVVEVLVSGCAIGTTYTIDNEQQLQLELAELGLSPEYDTTQCTLRIQLLALQTSDVNEGFAGGTFTLEALSLPQEITVNFN
jgi:hypothetical protein